MLASCVFTIGLCGAAFRLVHHGAGRNLSDLSAEDIAGFSKVGRDLCVDIYIRLGTLSNMP